MLSVDYLCICKVLLSCYVSFVVLQEVYLGQYTLYQELQPKCRSIAQVKKI
jgi:hypothetical protein